MGDDRSRAGAAPYRPSPAVPALPLPRVGLTGWTWVVRGAALAMPFVCAALAALGAAHARLGLAASGIAFVSMGMAGALAAAARRVVRGDRWTALVPAVAPAVVALAGGMIAWVSLMTVGWAFLDTNVHERLALSWKELGGMDLVAAYTELASAGTAAVGALALLASAASVGAIGGTGDAGATRVRGRELVLGLVGLVFSALAAIASRDALVIGLGAVPLFLSLTGLAAAAAQRGRFVQEHGAPRDRGAWGGGVLAAGVLAALALLGMARAGTLFVEAHALLGEGASLGAPARFLLLEGVATHSETTMRVAWALAALGVSITGSAAHVGLRRSATAAAIWPRGLALPAAVVAAALASGLAAKTRTTTLDVLAARLAADAVDTNLPTVKASLALDPPSDAERHVVITAAHGAPPSVVLPHAPLRGRGRIVLVLDGSTPWRTVEPAIAAAHAKSSELHPEADHGPDLEIRVAPYPTPTRTRLGDRAALVGPWVAAVSVALEPLGASAPRDADGVKRIAARPSDTVESLAARLAALEDARLDGPRRRVALVLGGETGDLTGP